MLKYSSGITTAAFVAQIKSEADISYPIPDSSYIGWLNAVEQLVYSEIIHDERLCSIENPDKYGEFAISDIPNTSDCSAVRWDDIIKLYVDGEELQRGGIIGGRIMTGRSIYWPDGNGNVQYRTVDGVKPDNISIIYIARPKLKDSVDSTDMIYIPSEFMGLICSYVRAEAYKVANEDVLSAKWTGDYNALLTDFTAWCAAKNLRYGE